MEAQKVSAETVPPPSDGCDPRKEQNNDSNHKDADGGQEEEVESNFGGQEIEEGVQAEFWQDLEEFLPSLEDDPQLHQRATLALWLRRAVPWLRRRGFADPELGPPLDEFAEEALDWPRDESWSLVCNPVWLARLCYHGFLSIMTPLSDSFWLLTPKLHQQRCVLRLDSLHTPKKARKHAHLYQLRINTHPEQIRRQVVRFHADENWVYPPLQRAFRLLFAASRVAEGDYNPVVVAADAGDGDADETVPVVLAERAAKVLQMRQETRSFRLYSVGIWRDLGPEELRQLRALLQPNSPQEQEQEQQRQQQQQQHPKQKHQSQQQQPPPAADDEKEAQPYLGWLRKGFVEQRKRKPRRKAAPEEEALLANKNPNQSEEERSREEQQRKEQALQELLPQLIDWERGSVLCGGEIGYTVGTVYTSLTGFTACDGAGTIQLVALGKLLRRQGFSLWDFGMELDYKRRLGAEPMAREIFVGLLHSVRDSPAPRLPTEVSCKDLLRP